MFYFILYLLLDVVPLLLILLPLLILWQRLCYKNKQISRYLLLILFSGYLFAVFNLTGFPYLGTLSPEANVNLVPFSTISEFSIHTILNVLLFVPFGFLLPILWNSFSKGIRTTLLGFAFSLLIELSQLLTFRVTDIDDLITNTLGTLIGNLIALLYLHIVKNHKDTISENEENKKTHTTKADLIEFSLLLSGVLCVWFFISPIIMNVLYSLEL